MNRQLIKKKYKAEFDHWLNGGSVLVKFLPYEDWKEAPKDVFDYRLTNFAIIINDEYVEFRKARAEGKVIQYRNTNIKEFEKWQDLENLSFNPNFEYSIKPEEPKFKVGDWCWFWNKDRIPVISQLVKIENDGNIKYFAKFPNLPHPLGAYYDFCEPFIGTLPTFLKDK